MDYNPGADTDEVMNFIRQNEEAFNKFKSEFSNKTFQASNEENTFIVHRSTRTGTDNWQVTTFENGKPIGHETRENWEQAVEWIEDEIDWTDHRNFKVMQTEEVYEALKECYFPEINIRKLFKDSRVVFEKDEISGGLADGKNVNDVARHHDVDVKSIEKELDMGIEVEYEHTNDKNKSKEIALDHLWEDPKYYTKLAKIEKH